jgi:hypothetical protein
MATYLVERYLPGASLDTIEGAADRVRAAVQELNARGTAIRYLGSTFVPEEEACFCHFEGSSLDAVVAANERAGVAFARVLAAVSVPGETNERKSR